MSGGTDVDGGELAANLVAEGEFVVAGSDGTVLLEHVDGASDGAPVAVGVGG